MTNHSAMLEAVADDFYKRAINHQKFSVDPEAVLYKVWQDVKHDFKQVKWADEVEQPSAQLRIRNALHTASARIKGKPKAERTDENIDSIFTGVAHEFAEPKHWEHGYGR